MARYTRLLHLSLVTVLAASACQMEETSDLASLSQHIIGGTEDPGDPAVAMLFLGDGTCTGTLIRPRVVISAAHCVEGGVTSGTAAFGTGPGTNDFFDRVSIIDVETHRRYVGFGEKDVSLLRLAREPEGVTPLDFNVDPLDQSWVGAEVRAVGFGDSDGVAGTGVGTKRQTTITIDGVTAEHLIIGTQTKNICEGDSGGPTLGIVNGEEKVLAVTSFGTDLCMGASNVTRTDVYLDEFILPVLAAWDGPCAGDGVCDEEADCPYIDPDCDICGLDGICRLECEKVDFDCDTVGFAGALCTDNLDCESRLCVDAPDDPRVRYCSAPCDPNAGALDECETPLTQCTARTEGNICGFSGPTPTTQGADCSDGTQCRSGLCDTKHSICVEPCAAGNLCPEGFECVSSGGMKICSIGGGGGCSVDESTSTGSNGALLFAVVALLAWLTRRRSTRDDADTVVQPH